MYSFEAEYFLHLRINVYELYQRYLAIFNINLRKFLFHRKIEQVT